LIRAQPCPHVIARYPVGGHVAAQRRGYHKVTVQQTVGRYRLDIVVEGPDSRLAVECDGDRWHGPDVWHKDRARQQVLERAGWTFECIRGSEFYREPEAALAPLWRRLAALGIPAGDWWSDSARRPAVRSVASIARVDLVQAP
jgi:very-short-patch-repair endonuclease